MNKLTTIAIGVIALLSLIFAGALAVGILGFFLIVFGIMMGLLIVLSIATSAAIKIFGRERVEAWLARRGIKISFAPEQEHREQTHQAAPYRRSQPKDDIEDAILLDETPGPRRPNQ